MAPRKCMLLAAALLACSAAPTRAAWPEWVLTPGSSSTVKTASAEFSWEEIVQQYWLNSANRSLIQGDPTLDACTVGQPTNGLWIASQHEPWADCPIKASQHQIAIIPIGSFVYFSPDNIGKFANPVSAEQVCALGPINTPEDDAMTAAISGEVVYDKDADNGGPVETYVATKAPFKFTWSLDNDTTFGETNAEFLASATPNYPDPSARAIDALFPTKATLADPSLAAPANGKAEAYPATYQFQTFLGMHLIAVDLTTSPESFNISSLSWQYTYDQQAAATSDTCALCGICPPEIACPYDSPAFTSVGYDLCAVATNGTLNSAGDAPTDGLGPFTWQITVTDAAAPSK